MIFDATRARDALDSIGQMLVGTKMLQNEPGVIYGLAAAQARPQDAQAIDQFMQSLDAEKQVTLARQSGHPLILDPNQQALLKANNVQFDDVLYTKQKAGETAAKAIEAQSQGQYTAKLNADGSPVVDKAGQIATQKVEQKQADDSGHGFWDGVGHFFTHVGHDLTNWVWHDTTQKALTGITKGYYFVQSELAGDQPIQMPTLQDELTGHTDVKYVDTHLSEDMRAQGYDPSSIWSQIAFDASGKKHTDLSDLNANYGEDRVSEALKYLDDPAKYRESLFQDPKAFTTGPDGQPAPSKELADKLNWLQSKDFQHLALQANARQATVGNDLMNNLGVDPINHPDYYKWGAAAINIAASFAIDPTNVALMGAKVAKSATVGIDTLADSDKAASILTRDSHLPWVNNVQRGWQRAIDLGAEMRAARAEGDTTKEAAAAAKFRANVPGLEPLMENFVGGDRVFAGFRDGKPLLEQSDGIHDLAQAAEFVRSKDALLRLQSGRAGTQVSLMPGALSAFGYRKVKGLTAGWMTTRSSARAEKAYATVLSKADADPSLAKQLIGTGMLVRLMPAADDAVGVDGTVLAERALADDPTLLASQSRNYALTSAGKGDIAANLRNTGDELGMSHLGRYSPTAIAARSRMAAQRLSTLLPRDTRIALDDEQAGDRIYKTALTYLNRGDANTLRSLWNTGDGGQRKAIIGGLVDQIGHAAGLGHSESGQAILNQAKTAVQRYSSSGEEVMLEGHEPLALFPGQTRSEWLLPTFRALQQASAKVGLWEATMGHALTSTQADNAMYWWKMGALFKPSTATRNMLEGWLRTALEGRAGAAIKARAVLTARNKELWARGYGDDTKALYDEALAGGDTATANEIANGSMLSGQMLGRGRISSRLADTAPLALAGRAYRTLVGRHMDEETVQAMLTLGKDDLAHALHGYRTQRMIGDLGMTRAAAEATDVTKAGFAPSRPRVALHDARKKDREVVDGGPRREYTDQALDDTEGADRYSHALAQRIHTAPKTTHAVLDYIEHRRAAALEAAKGETDVQAPTIDNIMQAMEEEKGLTAFGTVHFPNPDDSTVAVRAVTDAERAEGKRIWAMKLVSEWTHMLHGQNGVYQKKIADYLRTGTAPDGEWISKYIVGHNRPETALALKTEAKVNGDLKSIPQTLQDMSGAAYQWMVERPLQRTTTSPVFLANYAIARKGMNQAVDKMVANGMSRESAESLAKELSIKNAWVKSEHMIDDPGQKAQFDVIARNMFPFARATQAMIRRWGTGLWQNPAAARRMMLAYEGAQHAGLIYTNSYGEPTFTYPGSGVMGQVMQGLAKIPGWEGIARFPVASDMTGGVLMSVPGADNPLRMGMGPMLSIPLRELYKHILPTAWQGNAEKVDAFVNGEIGVGETWSQLVPTAVRKFYQAISSDDRNSAMASSMNGAIANLAAAGLTPTMNATEDERQLFRGRVQTQVQNQLFLRAIFGLFAPAAPSAPSEGTSASESDFAFQHEGIQQLSDEYKTILNEAGGDVARANAVFTYMHPDEVVWKHGVNTVHKLTASAYETAKSKSNVPGAYLPATEKSLQWLHTHGDVIDKYKSVAAYFVPHSATRDPFSDAAYQTQLELELRLRKTPTEFMNDVYVKHAEAQFYPFADYWDQQIAAVKKTGDTATASAMTAAKSQWETQYKNLNPLFDAKLRDYTAARGVAEDQFRTLKNMVHAGEVPDGQGEDLANLITAYEGYHQFVRDHPGGTKDARALRDQALFIFNDWVSKNVQGTGLQPVYDGVFRVLNTNFVTMNNGST